jgi:hypothetical protein
MIYVSSEADHPFFVAFENIKNAKLEPHSVYWHDQHDHHMRGLSFENFLEDKHWEHLRQDPTSKILLYYSDEYFNIVDLEIYVNTIKKQKINPSQIFFVVIDENWKTWVINEFEKRGVIGINVTEYNLLLKKSFIVKRSDLIDIIVNGDSIKEYFKSKWTPKKIPFIPKPAPKIEKKFSAFSRRFDHWRLQLFAELYLGKLLDQFKYTFNNIDPYAGSVGHNKTREFSVDEVLELLKSKNYNLDLLDDWVNGMPYTFPKIDVTHKWNLRSNEWIEDSAFHLLVESHFDPFNHFQEYKSKYSVQEFAPSLITEKTWKVITSSRPFIVFATPYFLEDMRSLGYKTFHPYIDETYDTIEDQVERLHAVVKEINRLNNLPPDEFDSIFKKCYNIALENAKVCENLTKRLVFKNEFNWINQYLQKGN